MTDDEILAEMARVANEAAFHPTFDDGPREFDVATIGPALRPLGASLSLSARDRALSFSWHFDTASGLLAIAHEAAAAARQGDERRILALCRLGFHMGAVGEDPLAGLRECLDAITAAAGEGAVALVLREVSSTLDQARAHGARLPPEARQMVRDHFAALGVPLTVTGPEGPTEETRP